MEFSVRSMRLLIGNYTDGRVSEQASIELGETLESVAEDLAEDAVELAREEGYQTVKQEHIQKVLRQRTSLETSSSLTFRSGETG